MSDTTIVEENPSPTADIVDVTIAKKTVRIYRVANMSENAFLAIYEPYIQDGSIDEEDRVEKCLNRLEKSLSESTAASVVLNHVQDLYCAVICSSMLCIMPSLIEAVGNRIVETDKSLLNRQHCSSAMCLIHMITLVGNVACLSKFVGLSGVKVDVTGPHETTSLILAAKNGNVEMVKVLLDNGADAFKVDDEKRSALDHAYFGYHIAVIGLLCKRYPHLPFGEIHNRLSNVIRVDTSRFSSEWKLAFPKDISLSCQDVLYFACMIGNESFVASCLNSPTWTGDVNQMLKKSRYVKVGGVDYKIDVEETVLYIACYYGHARVVSALLTYGASCDCISNILKCSEDISQWARDRHGDTAVLAAIRSGSFRTLEFLLIYGAAVSVSPMNMEKSPLLLAVLSGYCYMAKALLEHSAKLHNVSYVQELQWWYEPKVKARARSIILASDQNVPALIASVKQGCFEIFSFLLGAGVSAAGQRFASTLAANNLNVDMLRTLHKHEPTAFDEVNAEGESALLVAVTCGNLDVVNFLIDVVHVNVNVPDKKGTTAVVVASRHGYSDIVDKLIRSGAHLNSYRPGPLYTAGYYGHYNVYNMLLNAGAIGGIEWLIEVNV